jgi:ATP-dependent Lhr-like helicase
VPTPSSAPAGPTDAHREGTAAFSAPTREWFASAFAAPTAAQVGAWDAARSGHDALVIAPTGSGKTLAAFLWALDRLAAEPVPDDPQLRCRVLYVSPLKALAVDVERNLRAPLVGIAAACERHGLPAPEITTAVRTGDTPADERRRISRRPPDILITTPESLYLMLTSSAREALRGIEHVIVDEVHALAGTKRGAHLALSLERLDALLPQRAVRIGLSATVRPADEVARFLAGRTAADVRIVQPPIDKQWDLQVAVPLEDMATLGEPLDGPADGSAARGPRRASIWPHVEERIVDLVGEHRSTLVFANSRRLAERLCARLNEIHDERTEGASESAGTSFPAEVVGASGLAAGASSVLARAHHGSVAREERAHIEDDLKAGRLPAVVATGTLELGIDMGDVDLVVQVEAPPSVASGLQRVGRAGHQVGAVSRGVLMPKHRGDLVQTAVVAQRMREGAIEALSIPRNPLDVLAQQVVASCALDDWNADELFALVTRAAPFHDLPRSAFDAVLDMLAGRYPSDAFAELRPRLVWDRDTDTLHGRPGAQRLAVTSGGTIPDRGLFGVFLVGEKPTRVGELDEEMVYESRVGDVFALGASSWRIEDITHDRVLVSPAPGQAGRLPFWHGDQLGRPYELGVALGAFVRECAAMTPAAARHCLADAGLDEYARDNLVAYLDEQREATGHLPDDRTLVIERFRDELGDWRIVLHSPFGARVHAPWALLIGDRLHEKYGLDAQVAHSDDGIVVRLPDGDDDPTDLRELLLPDADEVDAAVTALVGGSALFASRFRECAARALLLPRRDPGRRSPLWQQRQRSAQLLSVVAEHPTFPIVLETVRECLQDVFDVAGLKQVLGAVERREVSVVDAQTTTPSPFARSLLFGYVAQYLYEGDRPLAERRAQALSLDTGLLAELLGDVELRDLLDADVIEAVEASLQRLDPARRVTTTEQVADLLRDVGPLTWDGLLARGADRALVEPLIDGRRAVEVRMGTPTEAHVAAIEDIGRLRDALGVPVPLGIPQAFLEPADDPWGDLLARYARTHGPFTAESCAAAFGLGPAVVSDRLSAMAAHGTLVRGALLPNTPGEQWCSSAVLRRIRRATVASLRHELEPVPTVALARFLPQWQGVGGPGRGADGLMRVIEQLDGYSAPAAAWESLILPSRLADYTASTLDGLLATGELVWCGRGGAGQDLWLSFHLSESAPLTLPVLDEHAAPTDGTIDALVLDAVREQRAGFSRDLIGAVRSRDTDIPPADVTASLLRLAAAGLITNDTFDPVRALLHGRGGGTRRAVATRRGARRGLRRTASVPHSSAGGGGGRWTLLPDRADDVTARAHLYAEIALDRHGLVTRGAVMAEGGDGRFARSYRVLSALEDAGRVTRGYVVDGLGASQFGAPATIDAVRSEVAPDRSPRPPLLLAATDPANPFGAALPWPAREADTGSGHRPGRKNGAVVALVDGELVLYVERGGRTVLTWTDDESTLEAAAKALADGVARGALGRIIVERADGTSVLSGDTPLARSLASAGFLLTPRGLRARRP